MKNKCEKCGSTEDLIPTDIKDMWICRECADKLSD